MHHRAYRNATVMPEGEKIPYNNRKRVCKICGQPLSRYNLNKYCFVHTIQGYKKEEERRDEEIYRKHKEKREEERQMGRPQECYMR